MVGRAIIRRTWRSYLPQLFGGREEVRVETNIGSTHALKILTPGSSIPFSVAIIEITPEGFFDDERRFWRKNGGEHLVLHKGERIGYEVEYLVAPRQVVLLSMQGQFTSVV